MRHEWLSRSVTETRSLAAALASVCVDLCPASGIMVTLEGDLGAGKTAFSQGLIQSLLPDTRVKSPTFSLIESYALPTCAIHHLDLYRLQDAEELEYLGLRDLFWHNLCLIEWASKGLGWLPAADIALSLTVEGENRRLIGQATSPMGEQLMTQWHQLLKM